MPALRTASPEHLTYLIRSSRKTSPARMLARLTLATGVTLWTAGCGSGAVSPPTASDPTSSAAAVATVPATAAAMGMATHAHEAAHHGLFTFGEPGKAADSTRVIEINGGDDLKWSPAKLDVSLGETVTLRVVNKGTLPHDFLLGDAALQREHATEMAAAGGTMPDDEHHVTVQPGESKDVVWHFTQAGEVLYGCHTPGHYEAGMLGTVTVQ